MNKRDSAEERNCEKQGTGDFKPQLVQRVTKRAKGRSCGALDGAKSAAPSGLLFRHLGHNAKFLQVRYLAHSLDFNSLQRYNGRTPTVTNRWLAACIKLMTKVQTMSLGLNLSPG